MSRQYPLFTSASDYCPRGEHRFETATVSPPNLFTPGATMVYCINCPFHYFPTIPQDEIETDTREQPL